MVEVGTFETRADAEHARSMLAAAAIPSVLVPDPADGPYPLDLSGGARLLVAEADAEAAAAILGHRPPGA
jgi:hypothetical protein